MRTIRIPAINDNQMDFFYLFALWYLINESKEDIKIDFSNCTFLRHNAVAMLGGLKRLASCNSVEVVFDWATLRYGVASNLRKNGFVKHFGVNDWSSTGNSIPYREDVRDESNSYIEYLKNEWLYQGWLNISTMLRDAISSKVYEIYRNVFDHGLSPIGAFSCGQYYPKLNELCLSIVDFGIGIPNEVKNYLNKPEMSSKKALEWAFKTGNTTKPSNEHGRGIGLGILKEFIKANNGKLEIYSNDGYVKITKDHEEFSETNFFFGGTIINITIIRDEAYYCFASEKENQPLF
ncbi:ATP-binding protein [Brevibacillus sp. IT-7CA2]|uniref:ATP-binding protein n=1 Tax=Brevibacillus sp. IT-7CA2 TaxID=3026436 RepID=UPI0039E1ED72